MTRCGEVCVVVCMVDMWVMEYQWPSISHNQDGNGDCYDLDCLEWFDEDGDGVPRCKDNCPQKRNPKQKDRDSDGIGNACGVCVFMLWVYVWLPCGLCMCVYLVVCVCTIFGVCMCSMWCMHV